MRSAVPPSAVQDDTLKSSLDPRPSAAKEWRTSIIPAKARRNFFRKTKANLPPPSRPRFKPIPERRFYKVAMAVIALRAQGRTYEECGEVLQLAVPYLRSCLYKATESSKIDFGDMTLPEDRLDIILRSKAVRNVNLLLDDKDSCAGDKETTLEVMKGLGMLKTHQVVKGDAGNPMAIGLSVQIQMPPEAKSDALAIRDGSVGGQPFYDAETVGDE